VIVLDVDANELAEDDEEDRSLEEGPDERPEEAEESVLVPELELTERQQVQQFPRAERLPLDRASPPCRHPARLGVA